MTGVFLTPTGNNFPDHGYVPANAPSTSSNLGANNANGCAGQGADPVVFGTGTKIETYPLFTLPGEMGLRFILYYNSSTPSIWSHNLAYSLDTSCWTYPSYGVCNQITLYRPDGSTVVFDNRSYAARGGVATLSRDASTGNYILHDEDATTQVYSSSGKLLSINNASGIGWTISGATGTVMTVTHTNGQSFSIRNTGGGAVVTDPAGNVYTIQGWPGAVLSAITYPGSPTTTVSFKYVTLNSPWGNSLSEVDYNSVPHAYTTYNTGSQGFYGWATGTYLADGSEQTTIAYSKDSAGNLLATITNPLGYQSTQTYNAGGYLTQISGSAVQTCGATVSGRAYDSNNHLAAEIDNNGNTHTYTYAANGQLQTETEAYGTPQARTTDYVWDTNATLNRPLSITVEGVNKTVYSYNAQNRVASISVTNLSGNGQAGQTLTTTYAYTLYGNGMVQSMAVTRNGATTTDQYDGVGNLTSETNGLGQTTTYTLYNGLGEVGRMIGPNGNATDYTYDARGRVATKVTYPNASPATWTYAYDGFGLLASVSGPDGQVTAWTRDPSTMRVQTITHNDKDGSSTESFSYDANGDVLQHTASRGGAVGLAETFHYDALGRLYQAVGQNGQTLTYAYDGNGNPLSVSNAVGHTIVYQYDALNRVTQQSESGGASPPIPPAIASLNLPSGTWVPMNGLSNAYTVSWASVPYASYYVLQVQDDNGNWVTVQSGSSLSWSATGQPAGTYRYRVAACDATGCSAWSPTGFFVVNSPDLPAAILQAATSPAVL